MNIASPFAADYVSPPRTVDWWTRTFPSLIFYPSLLGIVWRASRLAKCGAYTHKSWVDSSANTGRLIERIGGKIRIENTRAIAELQGPAVIVGNHMSSLETFLLASIVRPHRPVTFVVKEELVNMPIFGHVMRSLDPIIIRRKKAREDRERMRDEGMIRFRAGTSVIIFPESTRSLVWRRRKFNTSGVRMAQNAGVPAVPLAVRTDLWGMGRVIKDFGPIRPERAVYLSFGAPITPGDHHEMQKAVTDFITEKMKAWGVAIMDGPKE